jgi:hypothetical protein
MHLVQWLRQAGVSVWVDEASLGGGVHVAEKLSEQMQTCRGLLLVASRNSLESNWVQKEISAGLFENTTTPAFGMTILRIEDVNPGEAIPGLRTFNWIDAKAAGSAQWIDAKAKFSPLYPALLVQIVNSLYRRPPTPAPARAVNVYVSRSDNKPPEAKRANQVSGWALRRHGLELIGDSLDHGDFNPDRIRKIMGACAGHLMILPARATESGYKYFQIERKISASLNLPCLVCGERDSPIPASLKDGVFVEMAPAPEVFENAGIDEFDAFMDDARAAKSRYASSIFFAHEYNKNQERNLAARNLLASVTGLDCHVGGDFNGGFAPQQIQGGISRAAWFLADLASRVDPKTGLTDVNVNTCIETGVALGAGLGKVEPGNPEGKSDRPVYATAIEPARASDPQPEGEKSKTAQLPWMLRSGITIQWYRDDNAFLAVVHQIAREHRRRILSAELSK